MRDAVRGRGREPRASQVRADDAVAVAGGLLGGQGGLQGRDVLAGRAPPSRASRPVPPRVTGRAFRVRAPRRARPPTRRCWPSAAPARAARAAAARSAGPRRPSRPRRARPGCVTPGWYRRRRRARTRPGRGQPGRQDQPRPQLNQVCLVLGEQISDDGHGAAASIPRASRPAVAVPPDPASALHGRLVPRDHQFLGGDRVLEGHDVGAWLGQRARARVMPLQPASVSEPAAAAASTSRRVGSASPDPAPPVRSLARRAASPAIFDAAPSMPCARDLSVRSGA